MGASGSYGRALWNFHPHQHNFLQRIQRAAESLGEFLQNSDGHFHFSFSQSRQEVPASEGEACVGSDAMTEAVRRPSSSRASSPKKSVGPNGLTATLSPSERSRKASAFPETMTKNPSPPFPWVTIGCSGSETRVLFAENQQFVLGRSYSRLSVGLIEMLRSHQPQLSGN